MASPGMEMHPATQPLTDNQASYPTGFTVESKTLPDYPCPACPINGTVWPTGPVGFNDFPSLAIHLATSHPEYKFEFEEFPKKVIGHKLRPRIPTSETLPKKSSGILVSNMARDFVVASDENWYSNLNVLDAQAYIMNSSRQSKSSETYFHSQTAFPILPTEANVDSEDEDSSEYAKCERNYSLKCKSVLIDEFTDVNQDEKELLKIWDRFIIKNSGKFFGFRHFPAIVTLFIKNNADEIIEKGLSLSCKFHLLNLHNIALLKLTEAEELISDLNQKTMAKHV